MAEPDRADGRALAWADVKEPRAKSELPICSQPEASMTGDLMQGKEWHVLDGVDLTLAGITQATTESDQSFTGADELRLFFMQDVPKPAPTNAEGRFTLHHLPADRRIMVHFRKPGFKWTTLFLDTGNDSNLKEMSAGSIKREPVPVQHSPVRLTLEPGLVANVRIVDQNGLLVRDGCIYALNAKKHSGARGVVGETGVARWSLTSRGPTFT